MTRQHLVIAVRVQVVVISFPRGALNGVFYNAQNSTHFRVKFISKQRARSQIISKTKRGKKNSCLLNSLGVQFYLAAQTAPYDTFISLVVPPSAPAIFKAKQSADAQGQRSVDSTHSSDRPVAVSGCWRINTRSRKRGLRIRSCSISEGSLQPISLLYRHNKHNNSPSTL